MSISEPTKSNDSSRTAYLSLRSTIKTGDVFAVRGQDFISRMIRRITGSNVSHVAMALWLQNRLWVVESTTLGSSGKKGVQMHLASQWLDSKNEQVYLFRSTFGGLCETGKRWMLGRRGRQYSFWQAFWSILPVWLPFNPGRHFCSQLIAEAYTKCGIFVRDESTRKITPDELVYETNLFKKQITRVQ